MATEGESFSIGASPENCTICRAATASVQRASIEAAGAWLCGAAEAGEGAERDVEWLRTAPAISLCRAEPDCDGVRCEAPIRRGTSVANAFSEDRWFRTAPASVAGVANATVSVQRNVGAATTKAPVPPAPLRAAVARYFLARVPLDEAHPPRCGEATISALLVANNLVSHFKPGPCCVSVIPATPKNAGALAAATEPSLAALGSMIAGEEWADTPLASGDLAAIHLLVNAVEGAAELEQRQPRAVALLEQNRGCLGLFLPNKPGPAAVPKAGIGRDPHPAERASLRQRLAAQDLLGHAAVLFAGTSADDPRVAAAILRRLAASDDGYLALTLIARDAARAVAGGADAGRMIEIGRALCDGDAGGQGLQIAAWLLADLLSAFPEPRAAAAAGEFADEEPAGGGVSAKHRGEGSRLWRIACGRTNDGSKAPFPQWIAQMLRAAAALAGEHREWSRRDGEFFIRIRNAGEALLGGEMLTDPYFHLFFVRTFACMAERRLSGFRLPSCGSVSVIELRARLEQIHDAYEETGEDELRKRVRAEARAAMDLPGFERSFRASEWRREEHPDHKAGKRDVVDEYLGAWTPPDGADEPPVDDDPPRGGDDSPPPEDPPAPSTPGGTGAAAPPQAATAASPPPPHAKPFMPVKVLPTDNPRRQRRPFNPNKRPR